jgi:excisionase family DNA binding protein
MDVLRTVMDNLSKPLVSPLDGRASFDTAEVARLTGLLQKTLRKYAAAGFIPGAFQPAGKFSGWRFKRKELEAWWASMGTGRATNRRNRK